MNDPITTTLEPAVACIRASTDEQLDSLDTQREQLLAAALYRRHALTPADIFADEGVSGATAFFERPGASAMLEHATRTGAKILYFTKVDRAFRNMADCEFTTQALIERGFRIHFLDFFGQELDLTSAMGKMMLRLAVMVAQYERERIKERVTETLHSKRARGHSIGQTPYGWTRVLATDGRKTKHVAGKSGAARVKQFGDVAFDEIPNLEEQAVLTRLVNGDLSTVTANEAARQLNAESIPAKKGGQWHGATIESVRRTARLAPQFAAAA